VDLPASHALDHALQDPEGQKAAAAFLLSHKRLVDPQISYLPEEKELATRAAALKRKSDLLRIVAQSAFIVTPRREPPSKVGGDGIAAQLTAVLAAGITTQPWVKRA
jgi:hypothetical protein